MGYEGSRSLKKLLFNSVVGALDISRLHSTFQVELDFFSLLRDNKKQCYATSHWYFLLIWRHRPRHTVNWAVDFATSASKKKKAYLLKSKRRWRFWSQRWKHQDQSKKIGQILVNWKRIKRISQLTLITAICKKVDLPM